jgi:hypothetical protein
MTTNYETQRRRPEPRTPWLFALITDLAARATARTRIDRDRRGRQVVLRSLFTSSITDDHADNNVQQEVL